MQILDHNNRFAARRWPHKPPQATPQPPHNTLVNVTRSTCRAAGKDNSVCWRLLRGDKADAHTVRLAAAWRSLQGSVEACLV